MCCISHYVVTYTTTRTPGNDWSIYSKTIGDICSHSTRSNKTERLFIVYPQGSQASVAGKWVRVDVEGTRIYYML